jgi:hypothetical protein
MANEILLLREVNLNFTKSGFLNDDVTISLLPRRLPFLYNKPWRLILKELAC